MTLIDTLRNGTPKNVVTLVRAAESNGWAVKVTEGEGHVERGRGESKRLEPARSVAVRLSRGDVRAFAVWTRAAGDDGWKFGDAAAIRAASIENAPRGGHIFALLGYRELVGVVGRADVPKPSAGHLTRVR